MIRCTILGSNGYIGRHIADFLHKMGCSVFCYDLQPLGYFNYTQVDLCKRAELSKINLDVDYIYVFAGITGTYRGFDDYEKYVSVNEIGLLNLLDAIRQSEFRPHIVYPSSRLVYKGCEDLLDEDAKKETRTIYAVNKLACEGYLKAYSQSFNITYSIFRICVPFGNLLSDDYSFGTVGFFINQARNRGEITLYEGGYIRRTFTSINDVCYQIIKASQHPKGRNSIFNVGGNQYSLYEVACTIASEFKAKVSTIPYPPNEKLIESGSTCFDAAKIENLLNITDYEPIESLFKK